MGALSRCPAKHVDTGMGFERLVRVIQNKQSNYDTDIFTGTIAEVEKLTKQNELPFPEGTSKRSVAVRVIADHIRAISFAIADGQLPSNTGAGYVIRRILRRAVRYYFTSLNYKQPLLFELVPLLAKQFEDVFPELIKQKDFIAKVIKEEEEGFLRTLDKGLNRIGNIIDELFLDKSKRRIIIGKDAFELFDTYGFPLDLTKLIASENDMYVDEKGFDTEMQQQKNRSRSASIVDTEDWITINENGPPTFVGFDTFKTKSKVLKYRKTKSQGKESYQIVLDKTPFYAESGGQVGDTGLLIFDEEKIPVVNTKKENDLIIHFTNKLPVEIDADVTAEINLDKRKKTAVHHSATHLLHAALRKVLGTHVQQKGSLVNDEYLRFDFSHFSKLSNEEISSIESLVNEKIRMDIPVIIKEMPKDEAMALGAMALFGEKYGDKVRVVTMDDSYSIELCGGTHVGRTGELGFFKITAETAVGAGLRRIEALSGKAAEDFIQNEINTFNNIRESLKYPKDISKTIESLLSENNELKKQLEKAEAKQLQAIVQDLLKNVEKIGNVNFIGTQVEIKNADSLKKLCFELLNNLKGSGVVIVTSIVDNKPLVAFGIDDTIVQAKNLDASKIIKQEIAPLIKGGGGGQKTLATAGGQDTSKLNEVIEKVKYLL